ncbi:MAG: endolytic transglycosylase MltG [Legionellaceae bacterium]|nr:endolytic transglycosylase MltG [Legionellaceae bacterium]
MKVRYWLSLLLAFSIVLGLVPSLFFYHLYFKPLTLSSERLFELTRKSSAKDFSLQLAQEKLITHPDLLYYILRINGRSSLLKAGVYTLYPGDTLASLVERVCRGEVTSFAFTIVAGTRWSAVQKKLKSLPWLTYDEDELQGEAIAQPEGTLLAETYQYNAHDSASLLVKRANAALQQVLEENWRQRAANLPYANSYELLIAASIIEKETAKPAERPLIASVIVNRLRKNMRLQMDPTVIYAMGDQWHGPLSKNDLRIDSPYNTYRYPGLPPTPIAMVSRASIEAAARPKPTNFLYFVAKGDGSHQFSENYQQQQAAVNLYIRRGQYRE